MLTTIAKRIQSRLSRQGVKISLGDVKSQCELMINDIDNPTENELLTVQEYFINNASQLVVIDDISNDGVIATPNETINEPAPLATTNKSELVANTAGSLGIELSTTEIDHIANNFDNSSDDFTETLEQVKSAIIAYVQHKIASNNQKINEVVNEIGDVIADGFNSNNETLNNGLKQLNHQLNQQSTDFKSKLAGTLSRFKLPAAS
ncbi:MAG: hypothetical protein ACKPHW_05430 [Microcystis panniformis]